MSLAPHLDPVVVDLGRRALLDMGEVSRSLVYGSFLTDDGFEVTDITLEMVPTFMKERTPQYLNSAKTLGLIK